MKTAHSIRSKQLVLLFTLAIIVFVYSAAEDSSNPIGTPEPVVSDDFSLLLTGSPFLRSLSLSGSVILTGSVRIDDELYVVIMDTESGETDLVTQLANEKGWKLDGIDGDPSELREMTARVATSGGEVFAIRFDERQFEPDKGGLGSVGPRGSTSEKKAPIPERDYREGISGDGHRGPTPPELVRKLSQLDENTRNRLIQEIREIRDKGVSSEERQVLFVKMVDRALEQKR